MRIRWLQVVSEKICGGHGRLMGLGPHESRPAIIDGRFHGEDENGQTISWAEWGQLPDVLPFFDGKTAQMERKCWQ
jgi:hypothetical protein